MKYFYTVMIMSFMVISVVLPNGLSLNSIGPKSLGMGGAFVGLADDYTAIYWNPAGLTQMQKNFIGVFGTDVIPMASYKYLNLNINTKTKNQPLHLTKSYGLLPCRSHREFNFWIRSVHSSGNWCRMEW